jgi:ribosomal protein S18 acetylase RimI-like enzyme
MTKTKPMKIRPYQPADEAAVIALWKECGLVRWTDPRKDIARKLKVNPEWFLVGEADGVVMATCMLGYEGHRAWINLLGVAPRYQRGGYGKALLAEAERLMRAVGCAKINLQVRTSNAGVIAFYQRLGFALDEVVSMGKRLLPD